MLHLKHCAVEWTDYGARVMFGDGKEISAWPPRRDEDSYAHYVALSHRLGYGDGITVYAREHELAHILIGEECFDAPSHVLEGLAHGSPLNHGMVLMEEMAAMTLQRWVRANESPLIGGCDWDKLKARFIGYCVELDRDYAERSAAAA